VRFVIVAILKPRFLARANLQNLARPDRLVKLVCGAGPTQELDGARITGGGSGGTMAALGCGEARASIARVAEQYARETGYQPYVFSGSSPGSAAFGQVRLSRNEL
jgi:galactokinase